MVAEPIADVNTKSLEDMFGEVIYTYTRQQAIEDGIQFELSSIDSELAEMARKLYKCPVYITIGIKTLIEKIVNNKMWANDWLGVVWRILWTSQQEWQQIDDQTKVFVLGIPGTGNHTIVIQCGPVDFNDPAPALTVMLPEEI